MARPLTIIGFLLLAGAAFAVNKGAAADDVAGGRVLARTWCANCHAVDAGGPVTDAAPSFRELAGRADLSRERLRVWLSTPHARMPNLALGRSEIEALTDYLHSLR